MKLGMRFLRHISWARCYLFAIVLVGILLGGLVIAQASVMSQVIAGGFLRALSLRQVWSLLRLLLAIIILRGLLSWGNTLLSQQLAARVKTQLRSRLLAHLAQLGPRYIRGERSGELTTTMSSGVEALDSYLSQYFPQLFLSLFVPAMILVAVVRVDLPSGIILLVMAPTLLFLLALAGMMAGVETRRHWKALSLLGAHFLDTIQGLTTLKVLGRAKESREQVLEVSEHFRQTTMATLRVAFFSSFILEEGATISAAIIAVEIGLRLLIAHVSFETALFVLLLTPEFFMPLRLVSTRYHAGLTGSLALKRIAEILETPASSPTPPAVPFVPQVVHPQDRTPTMDGSIRLEHVSYAYDGQRPVLHDISFYVAPGQKIALVGPSGAGKTTIAHLLMRFMEVDAGRICVGEREAATVSPQEWRKQIAWVSQHPYLFHATVAENIRMGCPGATPEQVKEAARLAHADVFIDALPRCYDTLIGEQGARLSGGEAQRISLARAFLRNAPILLLDEVTSYLDPEHEAELLASLARLEVGRTVLLIAHRLSAVSTVENIIVLDAGRIVARGTHEALAQQPGIYQGFVESNRRGVR